MNIAEGGDKITPEIRILGSLFAGEQALEIADMLVRIKNGTLKPKEKIRLMATGSEYLVENVGVFSPRDNLT